MTMKTMQQLPPGAEVRRAEDRGVTELGWLHSRHSFSFGAYRDPARMSYGVLRVLNDDVVEPGAGFGEHGHEDMEILTWVLAGALEHRDSTGTHGVIRPGDLQAMSAGRGIRHSEMNASQTEPVHFLQIWITPSEQGLDPRYAQKRFPTEERRGRWRTLASGDGRDGSIRINRDAAMSVADLGPGERIGLRADAGRRSYLHVATGAVLVADARLAAGDALALPTPAALEIVADEAAQILLFDLP